MAPVIQKFLVEGSALVAYAGRDKETLIQYLDKNMIVLKERLNKDNFDKILSVIWECSAQSLADIIHLSIEVNEIALSFYVLAFHFVVVIFLSAF